MWHELACEKHKQDILEIFKNCCEQVLLETYTDYTRFKLENEINSQLLILVRKSSGLNFKPIEIEWIPNELGSFDWIFKGIDFYGISKNELFEFAN